MDAEQNVAKGLAHRTLAAAAAEEVRRRILSAKYPAGSQLRQHVLSHELGISRIPIREALVQLEAEGLVRIIPHRGAVVVELSVQDIEELFKLRALLEPSLLRAAAPRLTPQDFTALDAILSEYGAELRDQHVARWGELNTALHALLYARAEQPRTAAIVSSLLRGTERYTCMQLAFTGKFELAEQEHAEIVALCRRGALDDACALLAEHISNAGISLIAYIKAQSTPAKSTVPV